MVKRRCSLKSFVAEVVVMLALLVWVSYLVDAQEAKPMTAKEAIEMKITLMQERSDKLQAQYILTQENLNKLKAEYKQLLADEAAKAEADKDKKSKK